MDMTIRLLALTTTLAASVASAEAYHPHELEPCINGAVSASGLFPSQALEDRYRTLHAGSRGEPCPGSSPAEVIAGKPTPTAAEKVARSAPGGC